MLRLKWQTRWHYTMDLIGSIAFGIWSQSDLLYCVPRLHLFKVRTRLRYEPCFMWSSHPFDQSQSQVLFDTADPPTTMWAQSWRLNIIWRTQKVIWIYILLMSQWHVNVYNIIWRRQILGFQIGLAQLLIQNDWDVWLFRLRNSPHQQDTCIWKSIEYCL